VSAPCRFLAWPSVLRMEVKCRWTSSELCGFTTHITFCMIPLGKSILFPSLSWFNSELLSQVTRPVFIILLPLLVLAQSPRLSPPSTNIHTLFLHA
jgi:hypothetical protein